MFPLAFTISVQWYDSAMIHSDERFWIAVLCQDEDDGADQEAVSEGTEEETGDSDPVGDDGTQTSGETMNK